MQILSITLLSLLTRTENMTIAQIANNGSGNEIAQLQLLLCGTMLFVVCAMLASQLPGIATGIAGGVHQQVSLYSQVIYGSAGRVGRSAAAKAGSVIGGTTRAIGDVGTVRSRVYGPAGRSIS